MGCLGLEDLNLPTKKLDEALASDHNGGSQDHGNPLNLGLQILCFFGAVGAIVITLLTLDALGRYVLHSREVRSKQTRRPHVRPPSLLVVEEEQAVAPVHGAHGAPINLLDRDLALFEKLAGGESHEKKEKVEGGKGVAPIERAPRLGLAPETFSP
ncbi:hypothetical protein HPB49_025452 [Dermacentor silvarum]|uniref:Uncharacterized protein n=1 Tax=Dermacentor silvarum TaxID=543639 RepID=A0ACB8C6F6_DERSI|nr:hypothetical protein HPB49_025452 [Dermacentor silvarum]